MTLDTIKHPTPVEIEIGILRAIREDDAKSEASGERLIPVRVFSLIRKGISRAIAESGK